MYAHRLRTKHYETTINLMMRWYPFVLYIELGQAGKLHCIYAAYSSLFGIYTHCDQQNLTVLENRLSSG